MPATLPPIAPDVLDGLRHGDERALERTFRDHYESPVAEAREKLDDPSHAPRVVETAFLRAWQQREQFETPEAFERFLHQATSEAAARERARHAVFHRDLTNGHAKTNGHKAGNGHHNGNGHAPATVDDAWKEITATLHAPPPDADAEAHARHDIARHVAAEHVAHVVQKRSWKVPIIIGVVALALVGPFLFWLNRASADASVNSALAAEDARVVRAPIGQRAEVNLADRTAVTLYDDSKIQIPRGFNREWRAVRLTGAGQFVVVREQDRPLDIRAGAASVLATAGTVLVRWYPEEPTTYVRLVDGSATVRAGIKTQALEPGATVAISRDSVISTPPADAAATALAFSAGQLVARDVTLRDALKLLQQWYALDITIHDEKLLDRKVSIDAPLDSPRSAIGSVEASGNLKFGYEGKVMVLTDAATKGKK